MHYQIKNAIGGFQDELEKNVKSQVKQVQQGVVQQVLPQKQQQAPQDAGTNEHGGGAAQHAGGQPHQQDQFTKEFIEDMYAPSNPHQQHGMSAGNQKQPSQFLQNQMKQGKTVNEAQALEALRKQLHYEVYYIPLTKRRGPQEEERPTEKVEREKMEELQLEEEKKRDAPPPLAVQMGAQRAEKFPGASG